jgi:hypothetical protein
MPKRRLFVMCVVVVTAAAAAGGCAKPFQANAFDGPDRGDAEVARLQLDPAVRLISIDGKPLADFPGEWDSTRGESFKPRVVRLLPGPHRVLVGINPNTQQSNPPPMGGAPGGGLSVGVGFTYTKRYPGSKENEELEFTPAAGRKYMLKIKNPLDLFTKQEKWNAIIYDADSPEFQKVVSRSYGRVPHAFPTEQK